MSAQYDSIAEQYRASKVSPLRRHVEAWSFLGRIGNVAGREVLDLACGEGFYSRALAARGAARTVGVDISPRMIDLANAAEHAEPLGIEYVCAPVESMPSLGRFDLAAAGYLLHYAPDVDALAAMCRNIAVHLRPGGRLVALNENPLQTLEQYPGYDQYGFNKTGESPQRDGSTITYYMVSGREMFRFDAYYYRRETYERVLRDAGFRTVSWAALDVEPEGMEACGSDYFREFLDNPPTVLLECEV